MDCVTLKTLLDADPRPTFVIDTHNLPEHPAQLQPIYVNKSLRARQDVFAALTFDKVEGARLRTWANTIKPVDPSRQEDHIHVGPGGTLWFGFLVEERWRVIQTYETRPSTIPFDIVTPPDDRVSALDRAINLPDPPSDSRSRRRDLAKAAFALSDAAVESFEGLEKHLDLILDFDWASTSLGAISNWPADLLQLVHLILLDPAPQCLFMGADHILIYNVAYAGFSGERHPSILGKGIFEAWSEAVELNIGIFSFIDTTGSPFIMDDFNISLNRHGFLEELYLKWTTIPLKGPLRGYLCTATEETSRKVTERRKALLSKISAACRGIRDMSPFWNTVLKTIGTNGKDFPFAFVYSKVQGVDDKYNLEGILDSEEPSTMLPATVDLSTSNECFVPVLKEAQRMFNPTAVKHADGTLPECIVNLSTRRGSGDRCLEGVVCPIRRASDNQTLGMLVVGLNTRKTFTPDDQAFLSYLMRSLGDLATNTINAQETDRLTQQAASQHQTLVKALATTTSEANHISAKWQRLVKTMEMVDVGFFEFDLSGKLIQANEAFHIISGMSNDLVNATLTWEDFIHPDDMATCTDAWVRAKAGEHCNTEIRYKFYDGNTPTDKDGLDGFWVSAAIVPVTDPESGLIVSVSGCITNIMPQKRRQNDAIKKAQAAEKLRASEERFHRFASNALCPIMIYDSDRKLQFCNDAYYDLMGFPVGDKRIWSTDWSTLIVEDDIPEVMEKWTETIRTKKALQLTCRLTKPWTAPDGTTGPTWIVAASYPEVSAAGEITGWVGVAFDISQTKWAETLQQKRLEEAVEAKRQQENFIDMTSHEIRNPLGAVVHCADSILASLIDLETLVKEPTTPISPKTRKQLLDIYDSSFDAVNTIISCSTHQRRIVDDVLTWSKLNSNLLKITPSLVRPSSILQDIRNMFELDAAKVGVTLTVEQAVDGLDNLAAEWVMLDPGRLMQVLINLVTNAIKFTREESRRNVTVTMGVTANKPSLDRLPIDFVPSSTPAAPMPDAEWGAGAPVHLYFVVEDTGCGLTPEEKQRIFARFSQGSPRTHTKYGGSGLGLYISRELVELQAGEIGFASEVGKGSRFGFFVQGRVAVGPLEQGPGIGVQGRGSRLSCSKEGRGLGQRYTVLVVEDNVVNQAVLSKQLRKLGHEVHVASHGGEALQWIKVSRHWRGHDKEDKGKVDTPLEDTFVAASTKLADNEGGGGEKERGRDTMPELSVILMDVEMPVMDGLSCAKEIRRFQEEGLIAGHIPIIAVSANARSEQVGQALKCGMDDAISKPFRIVDLMPKIERLVG
ncbi:Histidine kinase-, DNA gyrase B-, and HSP90-like ATPase-like protein 4 [Elsinoe fawcettii]|nr:Histidine kinase-, DNA gyrase B-, and HSP90-like ATPase-like protein 4 [Elsinoe fawcettii]